MSWRWIFWINLPVIAIGVVLVFFFLNQATIPGGVVTKLRRFDWIGAALFTASSTVFLFGITAGGVLWPWGSYQILLPLLLGALALVGFGFYEVRVAKEPLIDPRIFQNRDVVMTYIMAIFHGAILWALVYFLSRLPLLPCVLLGPHTHRPLTPETLLTALYYQGVKQYTALSAAIAVLPETLTVAPAAMLVGAIAGMTGRYRWAMWGGWVITTLGVGVLLLLQPESSVAQWVFLNLPVGLGVRPASLSPPLPSHLQDTASLTSHKTHRRA